MNYNVKNEFFDMVFCVSVIFMRMIEWIECKFVYIVIWGKRKV